jgi:aerobic-type carbon monoxide dehydrogenase small subunit (CoxS/CutS family)
MSKITLTVNGRPHAVDVEPSVPLLYVLRNDLGLQGPHFGCGLGQCGACTVIIKGEAVRSCVRPVSTAQGVEITTLEGLAHDGRLHPVQQAWIDEQVPQCGFCQNGMMIKAAELLEETPAPTVAQIKNAFMSGSSPHLCRCGSYVAILDAVKRASTLMTKSTR